jgi:hypothetical protein
MDAFMSPERVAEMKMRGDDVEAIREAEAQLASHEAALQLCRRSKKLSQGWSWETE